MPDAASTTNPVVAETPPDASVGTMIPVHAARAQDQFIVAGPNPYPVNIAQQVYDATDVNEREFAQYGGYCSSPRLYKLMANDPAISGSIAVLVDAVLAQGVKILPRKQQDPKEEPGSDPGAVLSSRIADEFDEAVRNLATPIEVTLNEMMWGAFLERSKLSELVWAYPVAGKNADKLCIAEINPKPREQWNYVCDSFGKVLGIVPSMPGPQGYYVFPIDKFAILAWNTRNGDPRGEVLIASCYKPWELRVQLWPEYFKFLKRSAGQRLIGECQADASVTGTTDESGNPISAETAFGNQLASFDNATSLGIPNGAKVHVIDPAKTDAFLNAFAMLRKEIVSAILLAVRATEESQHGSRADSQGAMDVVGNRLRYLKRWVTDWLGDIAYKQTLYNHGPEIAREHSPICTLGDEDHQDIIALMEAAAKVGYTITESMKPGIDAKLNLDIRQPGEASVKVATDGPGKGGDKEDGKPAKGEKAADKGGKEKGDE